LLFAGENKEPHETCEGGECGGMEEGRWTYKNKFQGRIIIENDRDHAEVSQHPCGSTWETDRRDETMGIGGSLTEDVTALEPSLPRSVQTDVVHTICISFGEDLHLPILLLMDPQYTMDDGDISIFNFEDDDLSNSDWIIVVGEEEDVATLESWHHWATERGKGKKETWRTGDLKTTTTGDSDSVRNIKPFQIISAEKTIIAEEMRRGGEENRTEVQSLESKSSFIFPKLF
jgi:hypothetical protein